MMRPMPSPTKNNAARSAARNVSLPSRVEIFRAGTRRTEAGEAITFSERDVSDIAEHYDPAKREAPLVVGHPEMDNPAYGWVRRLHAEGGALFMDTADVEPQFAEMVEQRRFPKRSAAFLRPDEPGNPTPGKWYLRHVGFLGAQAPSLQGLKPIAFASSSAAERMVAFSEDLPPEDHAPENLPPQQPSPEPSMTPEQIAQLSAENARLKKETEAAQQAQKDLQAQTDELKKSAVQFAEQQRQSRHSANVAFAEAEAKAGRLAPADRAKAVAVLDSLGETSRAVQFSEGTTTTDVDVVAYVKGLISGATPKVEFGERAPGGAGEGASQDMPGSGARMTEVKAVELARRHAAKEKVTFAEAYKAAIVDAGVVIVDPT